ncbi:GUN4 domain-containing protein [Pantanalinema rosaneae CENA516]|uniref:GUN4 domain-containing protein n=1 Tax=Pantanalinema rosaneae TaxID=1620701 RepID=UPI003D6FE58E
MTPNRHYQTLEIAPGATQAEIKQAYRDLALVWHPDRFIDNPKLRQKAEEKLKQINAAYEFLRSYQPQFSRNEVEPEPEQAVKTSLGCERLEELLEAGQLKEADYETKRLLLKLAGREKDGWLRPEDIKALSLQSLLIIDQLWIRNSNGHFGFSVQSKIWHQIGCTSSTNISTQTINENKFGQCVRWRAGNMWLSPWDSFHYDSQSPQGSLPREYIFTLSGWWSYSKGWVGYLIWRFDEIFLKF